MQVVSRPINPCAAPCADGGPIDVNIDLDGLAEAIAEAFGGAVIDVSVNETPKPIEYCYVGADGCWQSGSICVNPDRTIAWHTVGNETVTGPPTMAAWRFGECPPEHVKSACIKYVMAATGELVDDPAVAGPWCVDYSFGADGQPKYKTWSAPGMPTFTATPPVVPEGAIPVACSMPTPSDENAETGPCPVGPERCACMIYVDPATNVPVSAPYYVHYQWMDDGTTEIVRWTAPGMPLFTAEPPTVPEGSLLVGCELAKSGEVVTVKVCRSATVPAPVDGVITLPAGEFCSINVSHAEGSEWAPVAVTESSADGEPVTVELWPGQSFCRGESGCCVAWPFEVTIPVNDCVVVSVEKCEEIELPAGEGVER